MISLYIAGDSVLHRCPAAVKLIVSLVMATVLVIPHLSWWAIAVCGALCAIWYAMSGLGPHVFARQLWSAWWVVAFTVVVQVFFVPWQTTAFNAVRVLELVMIADLVTLTTRTEDMLDTVLAALRPLRRFGVNPDRIGLLCALTISAIPLINRNVRIVREANQARGGHGGVTAWAVPLLVLILKQSDELADALDSRGL